MVNYFRKKRAIIDVDRVLNTPRLWYIVELQASYHEDVRKSFRSSISRMCSAKKVFLKIWQNPQ